MPLPPLMAADGPSLDANFLYGLPPLATFARASAASYFDASGTLQTAGAGVARLDYDPTTHAPLGLLIEEARTNYLLNAASPATQTTGSLGTGTYTLWIAGTGSATSAAGTATGSGFGAATAGSPNVFTVTGAGTVVVTVSGSPARFQLENGPNATSFVATAGSTASRAADNCRFGLPNAWYNPNASTFILEFQRANLGSTIFSPLFAVTNSFQIDFFNYYDMNQATRFAAQPYIAINVAAAASAVQDLSINKIGFGAASDGSSIICRNGGAATSGTTTAWSPPALDRFVLGSERIGSFTTNLWMRRVRYWPRIMSAAEIQARTS